MLAPYSNQLYAIIGGKWFECDKSVTRELLQERWTRPSVPKQKKDIGEIVTRVKSSTGKGSYVVKLQNGMWSCTCASFGFRRKCKHIDQVKSKKH